MLEIFKLSTRTLKPFPKGNERKERNLTPNRINKLTVT